MQSTMALVQTATAAHLAGEPAPRPIGYAAIQAAWATVPDPRRAQGRRFSLAAILTLVVAALLANQQSEQAIAEWGASQSRAVTQALGFPHGRTPHQSTLNRVLRRLDPLALSRALQGLFDPPPPTPPARGREGVAIDGKAQRGRLAFAPTRGATVHALTAVSHQTGAVLASVPISSTAEKAEAELTVAPLLVARLGWAGRVLTGDALFCQRALCQQVLAAGGDYLLLVKDNQPQVAQDLALLFDPPPALGALPLADRREATTHEHGHGRRDEVRHLIASTDLTGYLDWPGAAQVFRLERTWQAHGQTHRQRHYGITSLPPSIGTPARLLALKRGHWRIENHLHRPKDCALGEDASTLHTGHGPTIMACLRDTAVSLLNHAGIRQIAARLRAHSRHPEALLAFLGYSP